MAKAGHKKHISCVLVRKGGKNRSQEAKETPDMGIKGIAIHHLDNECESGKGFGYKIRGAKVPSDDLLS